MSRPEDIPQDVWDVVSKLDTEGWIPSDDDLYGRHQCMLAIARAILAERERIAEWADALGDHHDALAIEADDEAGVVEHRAIERAFYDFASSIRQNATPEPQNDNFATVTHHGEIR